VGYSTARLSKFGRVVSFEHDPVHAWVAQHFLDLSVPPGLAEVWIGRVSDLTWRFAEVHGSRTAGVNFLDESGSTFHADCARYDAISLSAPLHCAVADNCLRPGAPLLLWLWYWTDLQSECQTSTNWSIPEFLEEAAGVEDWMAMFSSSLTAHDPHQTHHSAV